MKVQAVLVLGAAALGGCSSGGFSPATGGTAGAGATATASASSGAGGDAGAPGAGGGSDAAAQAARQTAEQDPLCNAIEPFYFEIGDAHGVSVSASIGGTTYTAESSMDIASASKLVFGAYVIERFGGDTTKIDRDFMNMKSGYTNYSDLGCNFAYPNTVAKCFDGATKNKTNPDPATLGQFDYSGGHFQEYAIQLGLGPDNADALAAEYQKKLGAELEFGFSVAAIAGGMKMTPAAYTTFLRKILGGGLLIHDHLGEDPVCTLPPAEGGGDCASVYSPAAPYAWHYSYGHWVEDDASIGDDGSFSSPGLYGFYPWIDKTKTHYGIVARKSDTTTAYIDSVKCGRDIRKAYLAKVKK